MFLEKIRPVIKYGVAATIFFAIIFLITGFFIFREMESHFIAHQKEKTIENMKLIQGIFRREVESLSVLTTDWAMWDQMYEFALSPNQRFIESNFGEETLREIGVNVIAVFGTDKNLLFSKNIGDDEPQGAELSQEILDEMISMWPEENSAAVGTVRNDILNLGPKKIILASRRITKSNGEGEPTGTFFFGRYTEEGFREELSNVPGLHFNIFHYRPDSPELLSSGINEDNPVTIQDVNVRKVVGTMLLTNIPTIHLLVLQIDQAPVEYTRLASINLYFSLILSLCYIAILLVTIFIIGRLNADAEKKEKSYLEKMQQETDHPFEKNK